MNSRFTSLINALERSQYVYEKVVSDTTLSEEQSQNLNARNERFRKYGSRLKKLIESCVFLYNTNISQLNDSFHHDLIQISNEISVMPIYYPNFTQEELQSSGKYLFCLRYTISEDEISSLKQYIESLIEFNIKLSQLLNNDHVSIKDYYYLIASTMENLTNETIPKFYHSSTATFGEWRKNKEAIFNEDIFMLERWTGLHPKIDLHEQLVNLIIKDNVDFDDQLDVQSKMSIPFNKIKRLEKVQRTLLNEKLYFKNNLFSSQRLLPNTIETDVSFRFTNN